MAANPWSITGAFTDFLPLATQSLFAQLDELSARTTAAHEGGPIVVDQRTKRFLLRRGDAEASKLQVSSTKDRGRR